MFIKHYYPFYSLLKNRDNIFIQVLDSGIAWCKIMDLGIGEI